MTQFSIITAGDFGSKRELEITIQSFAKFFYSLTKRHQKNIQLMVLTNKSNTPIIFRLAKHYKVFNAIKVLTSLHKPMVEAAFEKASLLFLPKFYEFEHLIPEAFSQGVPILAYENSLEEKLIDNTCGLAVPFKSAEQSSLDFCKTMSMLYFDSEVQKILKRGAYKKFRNTIQWKAIESVEQRLSMAS